MTLLIRQLKVRHRVRYVCRCGIKVPHDWLGQLIFGIQSVKDEFAIIV